MVERLLSFFGMVNFLGAMLKISRAVPLQITLSHLVIIHGKPSQTEHPSKIVITKAKELSPPGEDTGLPFQPVLCDNLRNNILKQEMRTKE